MAKFGLTTSYLSRVMSSAVVDLEGGRGENHLALKQYAEDVEPSQVIVLDTGNLSSAVVEQKDEKGG